MSAKSADDTSPRLFILASQAILISAAYFITSRRPPRSASATAPGAFPSWRRGPNGRGSISAKRFADGRQDEQTSSLALHVLAKARRETLGTVGAGGRPAC